MKEQPPPKQDRAALLAGMKKQTHPPQHELARLAAIVFHSCTARELPEERGKHSFLRDISREEESVRVAARLWLHAGEYSKELKFATEGTDYSKAWRIAGDKRAELDDPCKTVLSVLGAYEWVKKNAKAKKDQTLSFEGFKEVLDTFDDGRPRLIIPIAHLTKFLTWRTGQRSTSRRKRRISSQTKSKKKKD